MQLKERKMHGKYVKKVSKLFACSDGQDSFEVTNCKLVIVGDGECGKTCLVTRMSTGTFVDNGYLPTVVETDVLDVHTGDEDVEMTIFDTAGQEDYNRLRPLSYDDVDVVIICFNLAEPDTLTNVREHWSPEIRHLCGYDVPVLLVGTKKDLRDMELSSSSQSLSLSSSYLSPSPSLSLSSSASPSLSLSASTSSSSSSSSSPPSPSSSSLSSSSSTKSSSPSPSSSQASSSSSSQSSSSSKSSSSSSQSSSSSSSSSSQHDFTLPAATSMAAHSADDLMSSQSKVKDDISRSQSHDVIARTTNAIIPIELATTISTSKRPKFHVQAPVKHSEGVHTANRIGALAYYETSSLTGENVHEVLLASAKAAVLGSKKCNKFKPFTDTLRSWKSTSKLERR